jgi:hypothetical protein
VSSSGPDDGLDGRRNYARLNVGIGARLITLDGTQRVRLIDLSQGGAQLILSEPGNITAGLLSWLDFEAFGETAWHEDDRLGLKFERLLPLTCLVQTRGQAPSVVRAELLGEDIAQAWVSGTLSDD